MEQDQGAADSVYDFLYVDTRRIAQFSSQFNQYGHLTGLSRSVSESSAGGGSLGVGGTKVDKSKSEQIGQTRQFDPQWLNPLSFLDGAEARGLIGRDINEVSIGQFVLTSGQVMLYDVELMRSAWDKPAIKKLLRAGMEPEIEGNRATRRSAAAKKHAEPSNVDALFELLSIMPHSLQLNQVGEGFSLWCSLDAQSVIGKSGDLILKHGALLHGRWNILGIYDAYPYDPDHIYDNEEDESDIAAKGAGSMVGQMAARLGIMARNMGGRPGVSHGVTPLLIFREISGPEPEPQVKA